MRTFVLPHLLTSTRSTCSLMRIDIVTALPDLVAGPLDQSIIQRAQQKGLVDIRVHDLRDYTEDKHRKIDAYPFGGGGGMVLTPGPLFACIEAIRAEWAEEGDGEGDEVIYLSPDGEVFDQPLANELSMRKRLLLIAGHYKGIDQRVRDTLVTREISIGDYVLSGGELPALVLTDAARPAPARRARRCAVGALGLVPGRAARRAGLHPPGRVPRAARPRRPALRRPRPDPRVARGAAPPPYERTPPRPTRLAPRAREGLPDHAPP